MEYEVFVVDDDALDGKGWVIVRGAGRSSLLLTRGLASSGPELCAGLAEAWSASAGSRPTMPVAV